MHYAITNLHIVGFSAAFLTGMLVFLSKKVISMRNKHKIPYAHFSENRSFMAAISAQRNFLDYSPFFLLLSIIMLLMQVQPSLLGILSLTFVIGRIFHATGILVREQADPPCLRGRIFGMALTLIALLGSAAIIFVYALPF